MKFLQPLNDDDPNGILSSNKGIKIDCQSTLSINQYYDCEKALDHNIYTYFCSERDIPYASITFLFPKKSFLISHYTFTIPIWRFEDSENLGGGPNSFNVTGSKDGITYSLDSVKNQDLSGAGSHITRKIEMNIYDSLTFKLTSNNSWNQYEFRMAKFDVFGSYSPRCLTIQPKKFFVVPCYFVFLFQNS